MLLIALLIKVTSKASQGGEYKKAQTSCFPHNHSNQEANLFCNVLETSSAAIKCPESCGNLNTESWIFA